ncbi:MAG: CapA family protein [Anaerolineaceae bacterium]|nr:CapA family protein [Anaerolineaceae bacterium]
MHKLIKIFIYQFLVFNFCLLLMACSSQLNQSNTLENSHQITHETDNPPALNQEKTSTLPISPNLIADENTVKIWISDEVFSDIINEIKNNNSFEFVINRDEANFWIEFLKESENWNPIVFQKLFVLSVPYTQLVTEISKSDFYQMISNAEFEPGKQIWVKPEDFKYIQALFVDIDLNRFIVKEDFPSECGLDLCWRINSFDEIEPFWKVIQIDNNHPLHTEFKLDQYPLVYQLEVKSNPDLVLDKNVSALIEYNNYEKELITSVILTGTTAFVRNTALKIEENGLRFPTINLSEILSKADITHISNEVPFYTKCPSAIPLRKEMRFCSDPEYIQILKDVGVDIIELTGNHLLDWGPEAMYETLVIYKENNISYYGGGVDLDDAEKPLIKNINGNNLVFLGCNIAGPDNNWVTEARPGSLKCDLTLLKNQIQEFRSDGYLPIVTIQHYEIEDFTPLKQVRTDLSSLDYACAVIVIGSQAHFPQGIDFVKNSFIHYGLGNLFFDQMDNWLRKSTVDIHYFYKGKYINTELVPIINEDYGQPRMMTE